MLTCPLLTTESAGAVLRLSKDKVAKLCRTKRLYAWKPEGYFATWLIPENSVALYCHYNKIDIPKESNITMDVMIMNLKEPADLNAYQIDALFEDDAKTLRAWVYRKNKLRLYFSKFTKGPKIISIRQVVNFLSVPEHQDILDRLTNRHAAFFASGQSDLESISRHILMLQQYYVQYGSIPW